jgi:outer membrane receptor protein involved in Fe transport
MNRCLRLSTVGLLVCVAFAFLVGQRDARAQGVTGAAVSGTITSDGQPVAAIDVVLRNPSTGNTYTATTDDSGRYTLDNVAPGGPYILTAQQMGFHTTGRNGIVLALGQRLKLDLVMRIDEGEQITIVETLDPFADPSRTGPASNLGERQISRLPLQGRNFTDLASTSPQVSGNSIAGQNNRYNNIQIDGGANNDLFGLSPNGTPGGQANAKPISIEAIDQFVIEIAPFDVRQGSFTGGLINAITKRGTNDPHGTFFTYYQGKSLAGFRDDPTFLDFDSLQLGMSVGGPIVRDKLHIFVAADFQARDSAFGNQFQIGGVDSAADLARAGFDNATAERFVDLLEQKGILNTGDALAPTIARPDQNFFVKVSTNQIPKSQLDISYNLVDASEDSLTRSPTSPSIPGRLRDGYQLSNSGFLQANTTHTARLKLTTNWAGGRLSNELLAGFSIIRDERVLPQRLPLILVNVGMLGSSASWLAAGGERFSHANRLDQNVFQLQDNVTWTLGRHRLTFGTSNEVLQVENVFLQAAFGVYAFNSLDDFEAGNVAAYQRRFGGSDLLDPGTAKFSAYQIGLYVQDEWSVFENLTVTPGFRVDVPFLSDAVTNPRLAANALLPIDTGEIPSGNLLLSPRVGFNWNIFGNASTILRGGAGVFTGRPPYVWLSNAYVVNGLAQVELTCNAANGGMVPDFSADPDNQPSDCAGGTGTPTPPTNAGEIDYFDPDTKYPQNLRISGGLDQKLPWGLTASADFLYTRDVNGWYYEDTNLVAQAVSGEGRQMYGTVNATGRGVPTRVDSMNLTQAVRTSNKNGGRVYNGTIQLAKSFGALLDASVAYTYSDSRDLMSLTSSQALSNFQFAPLDGSIDDRNVRRSAFDRPHKVTITAASSLPLGFVVGLSYVGQSGLPYTWTVNGDVNADGVSGNDLAYVPASSTDITLMDPTQFDALNTFIEGQQCLKDARGGVIKRGACRNPWQNFLNARLAWKSPNLGSGGEHFELQLDVFNILNLLNDDWGLSKQVAQFENINLIQSVGFDAANNRPIYNFTAPTTVTQTIFSPTQSRWRLQLGARYIF